MSVKEISIRGILTDLENGLTRTTTSQGYDAEVGSIETKYELTKEDVKQMFQHPLLKNRKTRKAPSFRLVDDVTPQEEESAPEASLAAEVTASATETAEPQKSGYATRPQGSTPTEVEVPTERIVSLGTPEVSPQSQF